MNFFTTLSIVLATISSVVGDHLDFNTANDVKILNYALTLEHLEYAFYRDGLKVYAASDFASEEQYKLFQSITDHEKTHVDTLTSVITSLGGVAVPQCTYNFGYTDVGGFISVARALENTGVMAYTGVIGLITAKNLVTTGATIATIEARHASYLNLITGGDPFPDAFDTPKTPQEIVAIAGGFITKCPYDIPSTVYPIVLAPGQCPVDAKIGKKYGCSGCQYCRDGSLCNLCNKPPVADVKPVPTSSPTKAPVALDYNTINDIKVLNYALTLEHLEYAFYRDGMKVYKSSDFASAQEYDLFLSITDHEKVHVDTLTSVITSLGGVAVTECKYNFGYTDITSFKAIAKALENTGVMAYTGAIGLITAKGLFTAGATIATIEARHASYLNLITGDNPFPQAFDTPKTPQEIVAIAGGFITKCDYDIPSTIFPTTPMA